MSKREKMGMPTFGLVMLAITVRMAMPPMANADEGALWTYDSPAGSTYYALSLAPTVPAPAASGCDVLVMFDTSASQTGAYRDDALQALRTMLGNLDDEDRVQLMAVDLNALPLTEAFIPAQSEAMAAGLSQLERRAPLGATDLRAALEAVVATFGSPTSRPRAVVYIGDGRSRGGLLQPEELDSLTEQLARKQVPFSSFAVGAQQDVLLLATVANHTGGMVYVDSAEGGAAERAGVAMAEVARASVFWPQAVELPDDLEALPRRLPPLRSDRDTIVIGTLNSRDAQTVSVTAQVNGQPVEMQWQVQPEASHEDYHYLPQLVETARQDGGITLPTLGSTGLSNIARQMIEGNEHLARLGAVALRSGNTDGALQVAEAVLQRDPNNPQARAIHQAARRQHQAGDEPGLRMVDVQAPGQGDGPLEDPLLAEMMQEGGDFLETVQDLEAIEAQRVQSLVEQELTDARDMMGTDPEGALRDLKLLLETVDRSDALTPAARGRLRSQIEGVIREGARRELEIRTRRELAEAARAAAEDRQRVLEETQRTRQRIRQMLNRFNSLMAEGRYEDAEDIIAEQVRTLDPVGTTPVAAVWWSRFGGAVHELQVLREVRHRNFARTMKTVERALVPFPDDPPILYPDPQVWADMTLRRRRYAAIDLARRGSAEERILDALDDDTHLEFIETPLDQVVAYLADLHMINIVLDAAELDDFGIPTDSPVDAELRGISLRSALRLILPQHGLTYVIRDEVLLITTPEAAEERMLTKVYPVGDLVIPPMGAMGGGMMGGSMMGGSMMGGGMMGGGMMGGGMMGGGMMGGGMMGGDMMGGMGGGMFCWVAREVYGADDPRWREFREWLFTAAPDWLFHLYGTYGEDFALWIHDKPWVKVAVRSAMDVAIGSRRQLAELRLHAGDHRGESRVRGVSPGVTRQSTAMFAVDDDRSLSLGEDNRVE